MVLIKYTVTLCVFKHGDDMREWQPTAQRHKLRLLDVIHINRQVAALDYKTFISSLPTQNLDSHNTHFFLHQGAINIG